MSGSSSYNSKLGLCFIISTCMCLGLASSQLSSTFYSTSCPNALTIINTAVTSAINTEARMGASLLRLHFHDCFVNACSSLFLV